MEYVCKYAYACGVENDTGLIPERLICMFPKNSDQMVLVWESRILKLPPVRYTLVPQNRHPRIYRKLNPHGKVGLLVRATGLNLSTTTDQQQYNQSPRGRIGLSEKSLLDATEDRVFWDCIEVLNNLNFRGKAKPVTVLNHGHLEYTSCRYVGDTPGSIALEDLLVLIWRRA